MKKSLALAIFATLVLYGAFSLMKQDEQSRGEIYATNGGDVPIPKSQPDKVMHTEKQPTRNYMIPTDSTIIKVGSRTNIPGRDKIEIVNESPITFSNGSNQLSAGETCIVEFGSLITVKEVRGDNLLVEYAARSSPPGTQCPSGVQFIVSKSKFASMSDRYAANRDAIKSKKKLMEQMEQLLAQNFYGETMAVDKWRWVQVLGDNPLVYSVSDGRVYFFFSKLCGIGPSRRDGFVTEGGTIQVRGEANGRVLYEYTAYGNSIGKECPSGVLFFSQR